MKSKQRDKGNSNSKSSLDKGDCGQLKNEVLKALNGSGELLRSVEASTRDEVARSQEVGFRGLVLVIVVEVLIRWGLVPGVLRFFSSKNGSCGGVSVSGNQVVYFNFEEDKDPKGVNFGGSAIDLFVDLGGLEPFVRKVDEVSVAVARCGSVADRCGWLWRGGSIADRWVTDRCASAAIRFYASVGWFVLVREGTGAATRAPELGGAVE
ncbi:hypothetical protein LWI29_019108 [Acer saccharum]|uniref:Uncharacterized protein n=1 Tax=Acer saccharum TaxID=4024 RepID=A0AA39SE98_ACESA|nr:hypothetical protein LWI29_019108 [Acer saccharum]